jgi:hypothetical protein
MRDSLGSQEPFSEPWRATALRTGSLALAIGAAVGLSERRLAAIPLTTLLALWFTLGGHFAEVLFRNRLRARIRGRGLVQAGARLIYWFGAGSALYAGALATRAILTGQGTVPWPWWTGGVLFVALELVVHVLLLARGQPSFYDGRG